LAKTDKMYKTSEVEHKKHIKLPIYTVKELSITHTINDEKELTRPSAEFSLLILSHQEVAINY